MLVLTYGPGEGYDRNYFKRYEDHRMTTGGHILVWRPRETKRNIDFGDDDEMISILLQKGTGSELLKMEECEKIWKKPTSRRRR